MCFLRVRTVDELCQGELILDVANYANDNVCNSPKKGRKINNFVAFLIWNASLIQNSRQNGQITSSDSFRQLPA